MDGSSKKVFFLQLMKTLMVETFYLNHPFNYVNAHQCPINMQATVQKPASKNEQPLTLVVLNSRVANWRAHGCLIVTICRYWSQASSAVNSFLFRLTTSLLQNEPIPLSERFIYHSDITVYIHTHTQTHPPTLPGWSSWELQCNSLAFGSTRLDPRFPEADEPGHTATQ